MLNGGIIVEAAMTLLDHPDAQALLADADLSPAAVAACGDRLSAFAQRYLPLFHRAEQRDHALAILRGKLTGLERKTTEPIARRAGQKRRPLQLFVGAGGWDDRTVLDELRRHVASELADPEEGVFILDSSAFPKKGNDSCGVARQWCGRLGKLDNCQVGVFLAYAGPAANRGGALLDARLYLDQGWVGDQSRRQKTHVPAEVAFLEKWRIGLELLDHARAKGDLSGGWVVGDDDFGRCSELRAALRYRGLRYVLDVPCNTLVRDVAERRPPNRAGGAPRRPLFERVDQWAARQPAGRWRTVRVKDGAKGPITVRVLLATVQTKEEDGHVGPSERLAVIRSVGQAEAEQEPPQTWYVLSNARQARRAQVARVHGTRHKVEEVLQQGKGEVGLDHYEVRSWVGWHHHMTLSLLALWFLQTERLRLGGKNTGSDGAAGASDLHRVAPRTQPQRGAGGGGRQRCAAA
jgi:SRSO17 transposase